MIVTSRSVGAWALFAVTLVGLTVHADVAEARYSAIVVEADTGRVIFSRKAGALRYPASLTKIMTLFMVFEALDQDRVEPGQRLRVSRRAASQPPSKLGLRAGQTINLEDALLALVTRSANDAATVIAEALAGSEVAFARKMTHKARLLGMFQTTFKNASGLPNRHQVTTAKDMVILARALLTRYPQFYHYFSVDRFEYRNRVHRNHNGLLGSFEGTDGIKTGYIRASGYNLVASVKRNGHRLIGVVFGGRSAKSRDEHMRAILSKSFARIEQPQSSDRIAIESKRKAESMLAGPVVDGGSVAPAHQSLIAESWRVQVGAFSRFSTAEREATKALGVVGKLLDQAHVAVVESELNGRIIYRAHLNGLKRSEAGEACTALRRIEIECIALPPSG